MIRAAHAAGRKIGICGQAPSDYPEFARFLVEQGIDSISLNPDSVLKTMLAIVEAERPLAERGADSGLGATRTPNARPAARQPAVTGANRVRPLPHHYDVNLTGGRCGHAPGESEEMRW